MAYGSGKYPTEAASKIAHMKLLQNPTISALITQFDAVDPGADPAAGECTRCGVVAAGAENAVSCTTAGASAAGAAATTAGA